MDPSAFVSPASSVAESSSLGQGAPEFIAVGAGAASTDAVRSILAALQSISPQAHPVSGKFIARAGTEDAKATALTDISGLPKDIQHVLTTFRSVALEALVPGAVVSVTSSAASSMKRIQQGQ